MLTRLQRAFVAVEVWSRHTGGKNDKDQMIGLAKVKTLGLTTTYQSRSGDSEPNTTSTCAAAIGALLTSRVIVLIHLGFRFTSSAFHHEKALPGQSQLCAILFE